ncbi:UDP-N-acetylmuramoyl-tripeptide--D-alanyl-D-alanine ligase [Leeuwenhoekiella sp. W20_SRS_FM14]|uniref:UDP-N-acetylmuramoyl-tripeptide--D-alanyl-D- alanine ligase n=1 Tax=Leeuwenhoekiella sp. W20_SRS_FM14 TaxID=3240270 RepID=UPI003F9D31D7
MEINDIHSLFLKSKGVTTDTRKIKRDTIFFALKGDNFNGNTYAVEALEYGASYAIIDDKDYASDNNRIILVADALKTLQDLAHIHRKHLDIPILALTGSNGKTTTKELINSVLSKKFKTVATQGNLNNHIGVPLTLLSMTSDTEFGIVEMGANHIGEIEQLTEIAAPDFGYITNFGKAHLEGFGGVAGVVKGKSELYTYLIGHKGTLFLNLDDPIQKSKTGQTHSYTFSQSEGSDVHFRYETANPFASLILNNQHLKSNLIGQYNTINIAAAAAIGCYFKINTEDIINAIESYIPSNNRSQIIEREEQTIILDAYNANPSSMEAALNNFAGLEAKSKIAFLGDMFELGESAVEEHQYIADLARNLDLENVVFLGENFKKIKTKNHQYKNIKDLEEKGLPAEISYLLPQATILIKGSRGMKLEGILDLLNN